MSKSRFKRVSVHFNEEEFRALAKLAGAERRTPQNQAACLIVDRLRTCGLLTPSPDETKENDNGS
jgi:hypothetical protein